MFHCRFKQTKNIFLFICQTGVKTGKKYEAPNPEEQKVVTRFGYTSENLALLRASPQKIKETKLFFLNPDYVQEHAGEGAIARASWLGNFNYDSQFNVFVRDIIYHSRARGVRRGVVAEAFRQERHQPHDCSEHSRGMEQSDLSSAQKNQGPYRTIASNEFKAHYDALLADQESAVKALDDKTAAGLAGLMQAYLAVRGQ